MTNDLPTPFFRRRRDETGRRTSMPAALRDATRLTRAGRLGDATALIQRVVGDADGSGTGSAGAPAPATRGPTRLARNVPPSRDQRTTQRLTTQRFTSAAGSRDYALYLPAGPLQGAGLLVLLHGCSQSAHDVAAGTRMHALADRHRMIVAYPQQSNQANASRCWNWFVPEHQTRERGEPAIVAGITREVLDRHPVDAGRVWVAGMSAGAAMAVVLGVTHPDLFTAVGAHSGVPYAVARDMRTAFAAMRGSGPSPSSAVRAAVPAIVFHGTDDRTVVPRNGDEIVRSCVEGQQAPAARSVERRAPHGGLAHTRAVHRRPDGATVAEHWVVEGLGHAWSGGDAAGSYTDPRGPDASAAMVRFFHEHTRTP